MAETWGDWEYSVSGDEVTITKYKGSATEVVIPDEISGKKVLSIGDEAFSDCLKLTGIKIPDSVTSIGYKAFYRCVNLKSISIPYGVKSIEEGTFGGCYSLKNI